MRAKALLPLVLLAASLNFALAAPAAAQFVNPFAAAREAARRTQSANNLKQISIGLLTYHDTYRHYPSPVGSLTADKKGSDEAKPLLSWRVHLLPYMEEKTLYDQFKLDEPWDSEHNQKLIAKMPKLYQSPNGKVVKEFKTNYLLVRGEKTAFAPGKLPSLTHITDGTSQTVVLVEASDERAVVWTKPDDYVVDFAKPTAGLFGMYAGSPGVLAAFGDGSVQLLSDKLPPTTFASLFTSAGGEAIDLTPPAAPAKQK